MEKGKRPRAGERGISPRALAAAARDEAPGPGAERKAWGAGVPAGTARSPTGAVSSRGRAAQRLEDLDGREFEELILNAAARILAQHHGNMATLRPVQVLEEVQMKVAPVHYSAVADVLLRYPEISGWRLVRVERREGKLVYLRYVRTVVRCPLCGKTIRRRSMPSHAFSHIEKLEKSGVVKLERENGGWVVILNNGLRLRGASWLTLVKLAEVVNGG
jgi:hypothetical protein